MSCRTLSQIKITRLFFTSSHSICRNSKLPGATAMGLPRTIAIEIICAVIEGSRILINPGIAVVFYRVLELLTIRTGSPIVNIYSR